MKVLLATFILLVPSAALAHKPSDSYLTLRPAGSAVEVRWDVAVRDLDHALALDRFETRELGAYVVSADRQPGNDEPPVGAGDRDALDAALDMPGGDGDAGDGSRAGIEDAAGHGGRGLRRRRG